MLCAAAGQILTRTLNGSRIAADTAAVPAVRVAWAAEEWVAAVAWARGRRRSERWRPVAGAGQTNVQRPRVFQRDARSTPKRNILVDENRVYATGFSDGGFMDFQLGCNLANRIAAIAPVGAEMAKSQEEFCKNWTFRPVPLLMINGTEDPVLPYKGRSGVQPWTISAPDTAKDWAKYCRLHEECTTDYAAAARFWRLNKRMWIPTRIARKGGSFALQHRGWRTFLARRRAALRSGK